MMKLGEKGEIFAVGRVADNPESEEIDIRGEKVLRAKFGFIVDISDEKMAGKIPGVRYKNRGKANLYFSCSALGRKAEIIMQYVRKGMILPVKGDVTVHAAREKTLRSIKVSDFELIDSALKSSSSEQKLVTISFGDGSVFDFDEY